MTSAASRTAMSVSSPRRLRASPLPSRRLRTAGITPAARAIRTTSSRRGPGALGSESSTLFLRLEPEVDHRQMPRRVDHVPGQEVDGAAVPERGKALGVRVDELLLRFAKGGEREVRFLRR